MRNYKAFIKDSIWSIAALIVMNVVLQLVLYPVLRSVLGADGYGNVLYLIGIVNIAGTSVGCSANNSRLKLNRTNTVSNTEYAMFLNMAFLLFIPIAYGILFFSWEEAGFFDIFLYWFLMCATAYRNYGDVEYRLNVNYKGYFFYYVAISIGYLIGIFIFFITHKWMLLFLSGEIAAVISLLENKGTKGGKKTNYLKDVFFSAGMLLAAQLLVNIVLNADRIILKLFVSSTAVTIYYVASLMGKTAALLTAPLNSVIIGHLSKKDEIMSIKQYRYFVFFLLTALCLMLVVCVAGSYLFVSVFYPQEYEMAKPFFILANAAQLFYFFTGIIMTVLLRYLEEKHQLFINFVYCIVFIIFTIPITISYGIKGFSVALFAVNLFRFLFAATVGAVGLRQIRSRED